MESILRVEGLVNGSIVLGIVDNRLYVGLNTKKDMFEMNAATGFHIDKIEAETRELVLFVEYIVDVVVKSILQKGAGGDQ